MKQPVKVKHKGAGERDHPGWETKFRTWNRCHEGEDDLYCNGGEFGGGRQFAKKIDQMVEHQT